MKKIIRIGFLILTTFSCKAQIVPVEQVIDTYDNVEEGVTTYIKDVNNVLDDYVGIWKGTQDNREYTFIITERTIVFDEEENINADVLLMRHLIIDSTTFEIIEDATAISDEDVPSEGALFKLNSSGGLTYMFYYIGVDEDKVECGQSGDVFITLKNNNTQMYLILMPSYSTGNCTTGLAEQVLPTEGILLTKQ